MSVRRGEYCQPLVTAALVLLFLGLTLAIGWRQGWARSIYSDDDIACWSQWTLLRTDGGSSQVSLPCRVEAAAGETLTLLTVVPPSPPGLSLSFASQRQQVVVTLAGRILYDSRVDSGHGRLASPAPAWHFVPLPAAEAGQELRVSFTSPYRLRAGLLPEILAGNRSDLKVEAVLRFMPSYILCSTLTLTSLLMLLVFLVLGYEKRGQPRLLYLGLFLLLLTLLLRLRICLPQLFPFSAASRDMLAALLLRLLPLLYLLYFRTRVPPASRWLCSLTFWAFFVNFCGSGLAALLGWADFYRTAPLTHGLLLLLIGLVLAFYFQGAARRIFPRNQVETVGLLALCGGILLTILSFYWPLPLWSAQWLPWGVAVYVLSVVIAVIQNQASRNEESALMAKDLRKSQLQLLVGQIKPHFIYNTLSAIRAQIADDPAEASRMVYYFSHYLRGHLDALSEDDLVPFEQELQHIRTYTSLEQLRFRQRLRMVYDIQTQDFAVPPLTIQPLVENAVKHGVSRRPEGGTVTLTTLRQGGQVLVRVTDDGLGFDPVATPEGAGLHNIRLRLQEQCGALLEIHSQPGQGTEAQVLLAAASAGQIPEGSEKR